MSDVVLLEVLDRIATVTLNRPEARNALSIELLQALPATVARAEADEDVDVIIITGADPAFCAGLDLKQLGSDGGPLRVSGAGGETTPARRGPMPPTTKPVIGAINGAAVTGGFEIALNCDLLVASERARFADTHARVGLQPGWGLSVLLPQAIGVRRAREMSATGNFIDAATALEWGLVNHVVAHGDLLPTARRLAADIVSNDQRAVRRLLATYAENTEGTGAEAWANEDRVAGGWQGADGVDPAEIERRRGAIMDRGRSQV
ncbi:MAG: enoyl-CoA hydratase [Acidimicrobiales bacterium]